MHPSTGFYLPFQPTLTDAGLKRFGLSLQYRLPGKVLQGAVHSYLQIVASKPTPYPVIPDASQAVFMGPDSLMIGGAQSRAHDIPILQAGEYFGIRFQPGALRHFFHINLQQITNQLADRTFLPCHDLSELHNKIYECSDFQERTQLCELWLLRHYNPNPIAAFEHALCLIYQSFGTIKIAELAHQIGWSSRHLNRVFQTYTGLSSKGFSQSVRLQQVCRQLFTQATDSLSTALDLDYFDQSHLIKDYKKHLLANPSQFFNRFKSDFSY